MMRHFILFLSLSFISLSSFADSTGINQRLGSVWKMEQNMHAKSVPNEFAMVYGGADMASKPHLPHQTAIA